MKSFLGRLNNFFTEQPLPSSALQVTSSYISGLHLSSKERKLKNHFVLPLPDGIIQPSFERTNIKDARLLEKKITERVEKLGMYDHGVALLLPELSQRTFVFSFDSLPNSSKEKEQVIRFRVKKQMPLLPDDVRISYDVIQAKEGKKVVSSLARSSIIDDYENFFSQMRLKVRSVGIPILGLSNLIDWEKEKDFLVVNIEKDSFGLMAITNKEAYMYRQKPLMTVGEDDSAIRVRNIVQEIENTAHFIEDKEKHKIAAVWVRLGLLERKEEMFSNLEASLSLPVKSIDSLMGRGLASEDKRILAPLIGQLL